MPVRRPGQKMIRMNAPLTSLPASQRIATLDVIRGTALLGILIMNMPGFATSFFIEADGSHLWTHPVDQAAEQLRDMFFSGKFNSMFSLLFGIGFTLQFARLQQADPQHANTIYLRRLVVLGAIGLIHATLFWTGDVLHVYAALGVVMLFGLRRVSDRGLLVLMALCLLYPALSGALRLLVTTPEVTAMLVTQAQAFEASNNAAYGRGSFVDAAFEHAREFAYFYGTRWSLWSTLGFWVQMALTMLLGLLAGRRRWAQRIPELMPTIRRLHVWALVLRHRLRCLVHRDFRAATCPRSNAAETAGQRGLLGKPAQPDDLLRAHDRAARAAPGLGAALRAHRRCRAHAVDELPDANRDLHDAFLRLGISTLGQGRAGVGPVSGGCDLLRDPGALQPVVAAQARPGSDRVDLEPADVRQLEQDRAAPGRLAACATGGRAGPRNKRNTSPLAAQPKRYARG